MEADGEAEQAAENRTDAGPVAHAWIVTRPLEGREVSRAKGRGRPQRTRAQVNSVQAGGSRRL